MTDRTFPADATKPTDLHPAQLLPQALGIKVLDCHQHITRPASTHFAQMDATRVDRGALLANRPRSENVVDLVSFKSVMADLQRTVGGDTNGISALGASMQEVLDVAAQAPERGLVFLQMPLGASAADLHRWCDAWLMRPEIRGIGELVPAPGRAIDIEPALARVADSGRRLPVLAHGAAPQGPADFAIYAELARKYPRTPLILGQTGGASWIQAIELVKTTPGLYLCSGTPQTWFTIALAAREIPDKLLFGSAAPYGDPLSLQVMIMRAVQDLGARRAIFGGTFARLLGE